MKSLLMSVLAVGFLFAGTAQAKKPSPQPSPTPTSTHQSAYRDDCAVKVPNSGYPGSYYHITVGWTDSTGHAAVAIAKDVSPGVYQTISNFSSTRDANTQYPDERYLATDFDLLVQTQTYTPDMMNIQGWFNGKIEGYSFSNELVYCGVYYN